MRTASNVVRALYLNTVVRRMDDSRQRRGLPPMDRYGRRCMLALALTAVGLITLVGVGLTMATPPAAVARPTVVRPAPPTFTPLPTATLPTPQPAYTSTPGLDVDVDDHVNLPDGALTGGYCARKWWC